MKKLLLAVLWIICPAKRQTISLGDEFMGAYKDFAGCRVSKTSEGHYILVRWHSNRSKIWTVYS
jgi:hypothetical protein